MEILLIKNLIKGHIVIGAANTFSDFPELAQMSRATTKELGLKFCEDKEHEPITQYRDNAMPRTKRFCEFCSSDTLLISTVWSICD